MKAECDRVYGSPLEIPLREACYLAAQGYYRAVQKHGSQAFRNAQSKTTQPVASVSKQPKGSSKQVVRKGQAVQDLQVSAQPADKPSGKIRTVHFKPIEATDRIFNCALNDFGVYVAFYENSPMYAVQIDTVGTGLIIPKKKNSAVRMQLNRSTGIPIETGCQPRKKDTQFGY